MLDNKVRDLINEQVTKEFYSAYLYLDFAIVIRPIWRTVKLVFNIAH